MGPDEEDGQPCARREQAEGLAGEGKRQPPEAACPGERCKRGSERALVARIFHARHRISDGKNHERRDDEPGDRGDKERCPPPEIGGERTAKEQSKASPDGSADQQDRSCRCPARFREQVGHERYACRLAPGLADANAHPGQEKLDEAAMRRAMIFGSVMASFNVEEFGTDRVRRLTHAEINQRFSAFRRMTHFEEIPFERAVTSNK